ncbi:TetR/AcrR family transcriptional regulator [Nonomuraea turkmeniaca]|uniref:TetR/AcrR family transcriptional regulator n=1 Tax=Nonomuraea turkmeniaca TaxID=103838 RepID=A0A5S4FMN6_9ACTN|nr:TetR/AcrR family transcriptional regulator [Nonomuraea turkmeniaca]TMR21988.1 TetR/AcrR family transcriptional regulator [Nonomuraea turkmeniaca]
MGRASRADAAKHREEVVAATSRLLRERGSARMSVQDLMAAAGFTHGGFYKHFRSKEELVGVAAATAFDELLTMLTRILDESPDRPQARAELLRRYLSPEHRDSPGIGCPATALAGDAARAPAGSPLRKSYVAGVEGVVERLAEYDGAPEQGDAEARRRAIVDLAAMVGALTLARATEQSALSGEILQVVHDAVAGQPEPRAR